MPFGGVYPSSVALAYRTGAAYPRGKGGELPPSRGTALAPRRLSYVRNEADTSIVHKNRAIPPGSITAPLGVGRLDRGGANFASRGFYEVRKEPPALTRMG